jgi:hypothetical protein
LFHHIDVLIDLVIYNGIIIHEILQILYSFLHVLE